MTEQDVLEAALRDSMRREVRHAPAADLTARIVRRAHRLRTRRRATAGAAAALALVVAVPVGGALLDGGQRGDRGDDRTAASPSPTTAHRRIAADALLTPDDVNPVGRVAGLAPFVSASLSQGRLADQCLDPLRTVDAEAAQTGYWVNDIPEVAEFVKQLPDAAAAELLYASFRTLPRRCGTTFDPARQTVHQPAAIAVPGADAAMAWTVEIAPDRAGVRPEGSWDGVGIARTGNVVVVLTFSGTNDPLDGGWSDYAARTLGVALDRALGSAERDTDH